MATTTIGITIIADVRRIRDGRLERGECAAHWPRQHLDLLA
jgi:hypothetical protein